VETRATASREVVKLSDEEGEWESGGKRAGRSESRNKDLAAWREQADVREGLARSSSFASDCTDRVRERWKRETTKRREKEKKEEKGSTARLLPQLEAILGRFCRPEPSLRVLELERRRRKRRKTRKSRLTFASSSFPAYTSPLSSETRLRAATRIFKTSFTPLSDLLDAPVLPRPALLLNPHLAGEWLTSSRIVVRTLPRYPVDVC
jgi:hypothetical protein